MIETLRWRLIAVPGRLVRHAGQLVLRLPPGDHLLAEVLARLRAFPRHPDQPGPHGPDQEPEKANRRDTGSSCLPAPEKPRPQRSTFDPKINSAH